MFKTNEVFAFAPGWGYGKIDDIDFTGLKSLAFFDVPVNEDGTLNRELAGYADFRNDISYIMGLAKTEGTRVLLTTSLTSSNSIASFLNNKDAQNTFTDEIILEIEETGIDGVTIDFEYTGSNGQFYSGKYIAFIKDVTSKLHEKFPLSQVSVVVPSLSGKEDFYEPKELAKVSDKIFLMSQNYAVMEAKDTVPQAPVYGYKESDYWKDVTTNLDIFLKNIPANKIAFERAWYGNGNNYPLYHPKDVASHADSYNTLKTPLDSATTQGLLDGVPQEARNSARKNLPLIARALEEEGILTLNVLAYALATIEHETAGTFEPIEEYGGRKSARRLGYEGGTNYFGRGFIQLTHLRNYQKMGKRVGLGEKLVRQPELALKPDVSAKILAAYFKDNGVADKAHDGNFVAARIPVNPDSQGWWVASLAFKYLDETFY